MTDPRSHSHWRADQGFQSGVGQLSSLPMLYSKDPVTLLSCAIPFTFLKLSAHSVGNLQPSLIWPDFCIPLLIRKVLVNYLVAHLNCPPSGSWVRGFSHFCSSPATRRKKAAAAPLGPADSTRLFEHQQLHVNTHHMQDGQPHKESSSQADDKWELAICVTEVPRCQPQLVQLYTCFIRTILRGPLPTCLWVGTSGQHVQKLCSFHSFCSCRETASPPYSPMHGWSPQA